MKVTSHTDAKGHHRLLLDLTPEELGTIRASMSEETHRREATASYMRRMKFEEAASAARDAKNCKQVAAALEKAALKWGRTPRKFP